MCQQWNACLGVMMLSVQFPVPGKQSSESWSGKELPSPLRAFSLLSIEDRG